MKRDTWVGLGVGMLLMGGSLVGLYLITPRAPALPSASAPPALSAASPAPAPVVQFVAASGRKPFHRPGCRYAAQIAASRLETFATRAEAIAAGHVPCKVCRP